MESKVEIHGLRELSKALKAVSKDAQDDLKAGFKAIAEDIAGTIRSEVPWLTGKAAGSVKARGTTRGGSIAFGGSAAPYYPWLDFGGAVGRGKRIKRPFIKTGRYVYPTIADEKDHINSEVEKLLGRVAEKHGFDTRAD